MKTIQSVGKIMVGEKSWPYVMAVTLQSEGVTVYDVLVKADKRYEHTGFNLIREVSLYTLERLIVPLVCSISCDLSEQKTYELLPTPEAWEGMPAGVLARIAEVEKCEMRPKTVPV